MNRLDIMSIPIIIIKAFFLFYCILGAFRMTWRWIRGENPVPAPQHSFYAQRLKCEGSAIASMQRDAANLLSLAAK